MTVPMDMGISTLMGMGYSLAAARTLEEGDSILASRQYRVGMGAYAVDTAIAAMAYITAPDWMLMYYTDHRKIPKVLQVALFLLYPVLFTFGFLLAPQLESVEEGLSRKVFAGLVVCEMLFIILNFKRLRYVGSTEQFERGEATPFFRHALGRVPVAVAVALSVPTLVWSIREVRKRNPA